MAQINMNLKRRISDIVVDMTSWKTGEVIKNQYSYTVVFKDDIGQVQQFSSAKIKSDGTSNSKRAFTIPFFTFSFRMFSQLNFC